MSLEGHLRETGIEVIGAVPWGTHFCQFYQDPRDLIDILIPYFKEGLEHNEYCVWVTSEPLGIEEARAALARGVANLENYFQKGQLEILDYSHWYTPDGQFEAGRVLEGWVARLETAKRRGFEGLRLSGNTFWLEKRDWRDFTEYEAMVDAIIGQYPMLAICTYSLARCGAAEIMDVVSNHAFALIKRAGKWEIIEGAERKRIEKTLRQEEEARRQVNRTLRARSRSNRALLHATDETAYLEEVCRIIVEDCGHAMAWVGFREYDSEKTIRPAAHAGVEEGYLEKVKLTWADNERGRGPGGTAIRTGRPAMCQNVLTDPRFLPWRAEAVRRGYASSICLPLLEGEEAFGELTIYARVPDAFPEEETKLLTELAADFAYGIQVLRLREAHERAEEDARQQREWLRVTLSSIGDAVIATDTAGRITFLNPMAAHLTGWAAEEALGLPVETVFRIVKEGTGEPADNVAARVLREGRTLALDNHTSLLTRLGREVPIEDSAAPIRDGAGKVTGAVLVFHDVTEKRRALEALRHSERRVRLKLDSILSPEGDIGQLELGDIIDAPAIQSLADDLYRLVPIPMAIIDLKGKVLVGVGWQGICIEFHRANPESCKNCIESDTQLTAGIVPGESRLYKCRNHMWDIATPLTVGGEHVGNIFSGQFFFDDEPLDYELFRTQALHYGFDESRYVASLEAVPRLSREAVAKSMAVFTKLGEVISRLSFSNIKLARSVTQRDVLTERLRKAQEIAHLGSWEVDAERHRVSWSAELHRILGLNPGEAAATHEAFLATVHPDDRAAVDAAYSDSLREGSASYDITHRIVRQGTGEIRWVHEKCEHVRDAAGAIVRSIGTVQDITDRKQAEEALRQAQKLESIGLLAGGIAHDFNNLLVGVVGNASLASEILPPDSPVGSILEDIMKAGEHAAHLTRQLLAYAGKGQFVVEPVDLSRLVAEARTLIESTISKKITVELRLDPETATLEADRSQMQQVLMNLAMNAAEAIGERVGTIWIRTGGMDADEAYVRDEPGGFSIRPGRFAYLEVRDTGCGMDDSTRAKIFDPFFTTKFQGRGLGLAAVAGIVRSRGGAIRVSTAPGAGTTFRVLFPAAGARPRAAAAPEDRKQDLAGRGTILMVDDEEIVRNLGKQSLARQGYDVLLAGNGAEAIGLVREAGRRIRLVILDLSMPDMSGAEVLPRLRELTPELPVLVSSGYSEDESLRLFHGIPVSGFIQKPYTARDLARKVKTAIEEAAGGTRIPASAAE
jgi:PAS domain S-box-containing protein